MAAPVRPEVINKLPYQPVVAREAGGPLDEDQPAEVGEARPETLLGLESGKQQVVGQAGPEKIKPTENSVVIPNAATAGPEKGPEMASLTEPAPPTAMAAPAQASPVAPTHGMAQKNMAGGVKIPAPVTSGATDHPQGPETAMATPPVDPLAKERALVEQDKRDAATKQDMVGLGKALIHEKTLNHSTANQAVMDAAAGNMTTSTGDVIGSAPRGQVGEGEANKPTMEAAAGGGAESTPTLAPPVAPKTALAPAVPKLPPQQQFKNRLAQYDADIQAGLDAGTPEGHAEAAAQKEAKAAYQAAHPWGSAYNHPGALGKLAHIGAAIGNVAGNIAAPGTMSLIPGTALNKAGQEKQNETAYNQAITQETEQTKANATKAGVGKTNPEQVFNDLMHGGPGGGPKPNPAKGGAPYEAVDANIAAQGTGKSSQEEYVQDLMGRENPDTPGKNFTRKDATSDYLQETAGHKTLHGMEKRVDDYIKARKTSGMEDTPANREAAETAIQESDANAKALAVLPAHEQQAKFQEGINEAEQNLSKIQANSLQRGTVADEKQYTEDVRHDMVVKQIKAAKDAADSSDSSELAASIVPIVATMAFSDSMGIKRMNPVELERFTPEASGGLYRWAMSHADKFLAGEIPADYKGDVVKALDKLSVGEDRLNESNTAAADRLRKGATTPVLNDQGAPTASAPSAPGKATPTTPAKPIEQPATATHQGTSSVDGKRYWLDAQGNKIGLVKKE